MWAECNYYTVLEFWFELTKDNVKELYQIQISNSSIFLSFLYFILYYMLRPISASLFFSWCEEDCKFIWLETFLSINVCIHLSWGRSKSCALYICMFISASLGEWLTLSGFWVREFDSPHLQKFKHEFGLKQVHPASWGNWIATSLRSRELVKKIYINRFNGA